MLCFFFVSECVCEQNFEGTGPLTSIIAYEDGRYVCSLMFVLPLLFQPFQDNIGDILVVYMC